MFIQPPRPKPRSTTAFPSPSTSWLPLTFNRALPFATPSPFAQRGLLALDRACGKGLYKASLRDKEDYDDRQRAQERASHDRAVLLAVGTEEGREPERDRELAVLGHHDKRPDKIVPGCREEEDAQDRHHGGGDGQHHPPEHHPLVRPVHP